MICSCVTIVFDILVYVMTYLACTHTHTCTQADSWETAPHRLKMGRHLGQGFAAVLTAPSAHSAALAFVAGVYCVVMYVT